MKTTKYFDYRRLFPDRENILDEWIDFVVLNSCSKVIQEDGRIRLWGKIPEASNKYLRVVLLEDGETVHNAFFDRSYKEGV